MSIVDSKAKGGYARANSLSPQRRSAIAQQAALARWDNGVPKATHEGTFRLGDALISAAVLPNGKRLLTQGTFLRTIGRAVRPKAGTGILSTVDGIPFFLQADALQPFISRELLESTTPIFFHDTNGRRAVGYDAELLPMVAEVYLKMRDDLLGRTKPIPHQYSKFIEACDRIVRGLARVGIVALVDEATGYQEVRDRQALQEILDKFLKKEFAAWAKRFPNEFYKEVFRLRNWQWHGMAINRPQVVAKYTNDIVYARLAPGILKELQARNPKDEKGNRKARHHQWLTEDIGHTALAQHLYAVTGLMRIADSWDDFMRMLDRAFPKRGDTLQLALFTDDQV